MLDSLTDRADAFAARHQRAIGIAGAAFFVVSTAIYAQFIALPEIDWLRDRTLMIASTLFNALWWGFAYPRVQSRREAREAEAEGAAA